MTYTLHYYNVKIGYGIQVKSRETLKVYSNDHDYLVIQIFALECWADDERVLNL